MRTFLCILFLVLLITPVFAQETITLTTYYPAPFGVYVDMRIHNRLAVGDADGSGVVNNNDFSITTDGSGNILPGVVTIGERIGIGTNNPTYTLDIDKNTGEHLTTSGWRKVLKIGGDAQGAIVWHGDNVGSANYFFIGYPSSTPTSGAYFGFTDADNETTPPDYVMKMQGNKTPDATDIGYRDTAFYGNVVIPETNPGGIGIGTKQLSDASASGGQKLRIDVEGAVGARYYCDQNGNNCRQAPLGGGGASFTYYCFSSSGHGQPVCSNAGGSRGFCPAGYTQQADLGQWGSCRCKDSSYNGEYSYHLRPPGGSCGTYCYGSSLVGNAYICSQ